MRDTTKQGNLTKQARSILVHMSLRSIDYKESHIKAHFLFNECVYLYECIYRRMDKFLYYVLVFKVDISFVM